MPFCDASERNRRPILQVLRTVFPAQGRVLEIGAGSGQHAEYFSAELPGLTWLPSERQTALAGLQERVRQAGRDNLLAPIALDVLHDDFPPGDFQAMFSANTAHIMSWKAVQAMFRGVGARLRGGGVFALYGPFNVDGRFTASSNESFDQVLRQRDPAMGLRDMAALESLAGRHQLCLECARPMPANNFTLVFRSTMENST